MRLNLIETCLRDLQISTGLFLIEDLTILFSFHKSKKFAIYAATPVRASGMITGVKICSSITTTFPAIPYAGNL